MQANQQSGLITLDKVYSYADISGERPRSCLSQSDCPANTKCSFPSGAPTGTPGTCDCNVDADCLPGNPGQCQSGVCTTPYADLLRAAYGTTYYPDDIDGQGVYDNVHLVDLWMGMMAEAPKSGSPFGSTQYWILHTQFSESMIGDRFFYLAPGVHTAAELSWIQSRTLAKVIADNLSNCSGGPAGCNVPDDVFQTTPPIL